MNAAESRVTGLKEEVTSNKTARNVAEEKLHSAVEKLAEAQTELSNYKISEADLIKRAENAENRLKTVSDELTSLKKHISRMSEAALVSAWSPLDESYFCFLKKLLWATL